MEINEAISIYQKDPKIKKAIEFIRGNNNWVYELFDLVDKKVSSFYKKSNINSDSKLEKLKKKIIIAIFGTLLLKIANSDNEEYLLNYIPLRKFKRTKVEQGKARIIGYVPLSLYDWRPLVKKNISTTIDEYLAISKTFFSFIITERRDSIEIIASVYKDFRDKENLELNINKMFQSNIFSKDLISHKPKKNKLKAGRPGRFKSQEEFENAIKKIPQDRYYTQTELAAILGMKESNFRYYKNKKW